MAATGPSSPDTTKTTHASAPAEQSAATAKAASDDVDDGSSATATATASSIPTTYLGSKRSKAYALSKKLLAAGSLDDALSTLEVALRLTREMLVAVKPNTNNGGGAKNGGNDGDEDEENDDDDDVELHETLAPLYYLYGTTLLYSVEESDVMMAGGGGGGQDAQQDEDEEKEEGGEGTAEEDGERDAEEEEEEDGEERAPPAAADPSEDLQIAWENLDLARTIVSRLVETFRDNDDSRGAIVLKDDTSSSSSSKQRYTPEERSELLLDLAQIHTRLGDLQRADDKILPCISDYESALELRVRCLGEYDRCVADSHFSLAGACAEAPGKVGEAEWRVERFVSGLGGGDDEDDGRGGGGLTEEEKAEFRRRSSEHYLACGASFAGVMARMCGEDPAEFVAAAIGDGSSSVAAATASASVGGRSEKMAALRDRLSKLSPPTSQREREEFDDLKEMMDEIQEAMDTAEETEEGLRKLGEMKAQEMRKHEAKLSGKACDDKEAGEAGETTTIGFGGSTTTVGFGASGATAAVVAPTMMVVKKKKKQSQPQSVKGEPAKRLKTDDA